MQGRVRSPHLERGYFGGHFSCTQRAVQIPAAKKDGDAVKRRHADSEASPPGHLLGGALVATTRVTFFILNAARFGVSHAHAQYDHIHSI